MPRLLAIRSLLPLLCGTAVIIACKPPPSDKPSIVQASSAASGSAPALATQLSAARIDAGKSKAPDEALALLVSALAADPQNEEARACAEKILAETTWNWPTVTLQHPLGIDQISFAPPSSLWVSFSGKFGNTTARWNLQSLEVESVLFPVNAQVTCSLVLDPTHRSAVIQRGPVTLLCNAETLKPIRDLGEIPEIFTPSTVIAYSPDGLLIAHPAYVSEKDHSIIWHIKDAATGEIIRSSDPEPPAATQALTAFLLGHELRIFHADGSLTEIPLSPVEAIRTIPPAVQGAFLKAQFSDDGNSVLALQQQDPHEAPILARIPLGSDRFNSLTSAALAERFPWHLSPSIWSGLVKNAPDQAFDIQGNSLQPKLQPSAPIRHTSKITASLFSGDSVITGDESGIVCIHKLLPIPNKLENQKRPSLNPESIASLRDLASALSGTRYDEITRKFEPVDSAARLDLSQRLDLKALSTILPTLDFTPIISAIHAISHRTAAPEAIIPVYERLANLDPSGKSWPALLALTENLKASKWHQQLTGKVVAAASPQDRESPGSRETPAETLANALASTNPDSIQSFLESAKKLPPLLRQISLSRIAWLQSRKADALAPWPEKFPTLAEYRLREDWEGWEDADFSPALETIRQAVKDELLAVEVPENSTPEQRQAVLDRLRDPATRAAIGRPRYANACLQAALKLSSFKENKEATFQLANLARQLGAQPEPCLRAEALALTALGDYKEAHPRWITLITEHPVETHLPGDYAEAAYTAFENADPRQAMEILTTGIHRFPNDGNFAIRAGWVALLTGSPERAYQFLQGGQRVGFPADKIENATALLAIAAAQSGATDDATVFFKDLLKISRDWSDPKTVETLDWPEELKATLRQLAW